MYYSPTTNPEIRLSIKNDITLSNNLSFILFHCLYHFIWPSPFQQCSGRKLVFQKSIKKKEKNKNAKRFTCIVSSFPQIVWSTDGHYDEDLYLVLNVLFAVTTVDIILDIMFIIYFMLPDNNNIIVSIFKIIVIVVDISLLR